MSQSPTSPIHVSKRTAQFGVLLIAALLVSCLAILIAA